MGYFGLINMKPKKIFIDTNVLTHWIIITKMQELGKLRDIERYKKLKQSYRFVENALNYKYKNVRLYISDLTLAELVKAVTDFIVYERMRLEGIAAIYWKKYAKDYLFKKDEFDEFLEDIITISNKLRESFNIIDSRFDVEYYPFFIARVGLDAHDALLLSTAIKEKMNYFVTMDRDFLDIVSNDNTYKFVRESFEKIDFRIVKPAKIMEILRGARDA